jgi:predicted DNA-binding WGR domain protein
MRLENQVGSSNKFWEVNVQGNQFTVHYGRIGSQGRTQTKTFATPAEAQAAADKAIKDKLSNGYVVQDGFDGVASNPAVASAATAGSTPASGGSPAHAVRIAAATPSAAGAFEKLDAQAQRAAMRDPAAHGLKVSDELMDDEAASLAKKILGDKLDDLFDVATGRAEDDSDAYDDVTISDPEVSSAEVYLQGDEPVAYRFTVWVNHDGGDDIDIFVDRWVTTTGAEIDEDYR